MSNVVCIDCGKKIKSEGMETGYATRSADNVLGKKPGFVCYLCSGWDDLCVMKKTGHSKNLPLYLNQKEDGWFVENWPSTIKFPVIRHMTGRHNIAGTRIDVWFYAHDGFLWHGVQYGKMTNIVHCRRTKNAFGQGKTRKQITAC